MAFKTSNWALSNVSVQAAGDYIAPIEGLQYVKIVGASYDENNARYRIDLLSLANNAEFSLTYFFSSKDDESIPPKLTNRKQMGVVASVGVALAGTNIGIPNPDDIVGGVALADVSLREYNGKMYPSIWHYDPAPKEVVEGFADIEQYYAPEEGESEEGPAEEAAEDYEEEPSE